VLLQEGLRADTRYAIELLADDAGSLAQGSFRTALPEGEPAQRWAMAFLSCHQPFDDEGQVMPAAQEMLSALHRALEQHDVRQVVLGGDQMYSDFPKTRSLFKNDYFAEHAPSGRENVLDCSAEEVRRLFQQRYRHFWNVDGWRALLSNYPCYPILDDHDIVDNWGSEVEHSSSKWANFRRGAFQAYCDYQGTLVQAPTAGPPAFLDYTSSQANCAVYFLDIRSNRRVGDDPRVVDDNQFRALEAFLAHNTQRDVIFLVVSVPMIHLPRAMSQFAALVTPDGEDFSDRWSSRGHQQDRGRVMRLLHGHQGRHPEQRLVLLSGDIHIGCLHQIQWPDRSPNLYQLVSSGITHDTGWYIQRLSSAIIRCNRTLSIEDGPTARVRLRDGVESSHCNPCPKMNFGIVEVTRARPETTPALEFFLYSQKDGDPVCRYRSGNV
jgi:alkaline phosphatase D